MEVYNRKDLAAQFVINAAEAQERPHAYNPKSTGITTLIDCLYKVYLKRTGVLNAPPDPLSLMKPLLGTNSHSVFCKGGVEENKYVEVIQDDLRINGYIDLTEEGEVDGTIAVGELKTTWAGAKPDPNAHYLDQAAFYCAVMGTLEARIYVINIIPAKCDCFQIFFTQEELDLYMEELWTRATVLSKYVETPSDEAFDALFPYHMDWMCKWCDAKRVFCPGGGGKQKHWFEDKINGETVHD